MFKVLILVCSMNLAPHDCEMKNAIHVIAGPMVSSELSCRRSAQTLIFRTAVAPTDAEYVKILSDIPRIWGCCGPGSPVGRLGQR